MKIYKDKGSKERIAEMFNLVNKANLNENFNNDVNTNIENYYNLFKNKQIKVVSVNTQVDGDVSYVLLKLGENNTSIEFKFLVNLTEGDNDGVYGISDAKLVNVTINKDGNVEEYNENDLNEFNSKYSEELKDILADYVDVDNGENIDTLYESKISLIKDKKINEGNLNINPYKSGAYDVSPDIKRRTILYAKMIVDKRLENSGIKLTHEQYRELIRRETLETFERNLAYMNEEDDSTNDKYNVDESTDTDKYEDVVFLQGDGAIEPLEILRNRGKNAALSYLKQWHYPGEHMVSQELGHGTDDYVYKKDGYIMSWNPRIGYIGLQYDLSNINETEITLPDENLPDEQYNNDYINTLTKDKQETGDILKGGVSDNKSPMNFDKEQIIKGIKIEMEHTDNPMIALEIAMDHLSEIKDYYTRLEKMENDAKAELGDVNQLPKEYYSLDDINEILNDTDLYIPKNI